jgi:hypothetical protein
MAVLNSWQRIDRVISGKPFGDGADGSATISSDPNTRATITGTATQSTSTLGSAILSNGDVCILHQTQGTGAGQWEIQKVSSGGGTTSITWTKPLQYTFGTGAQCIKFNLNNVVTVNAHSITGWNGTTGGIEVICGKTSITVAQALNGNGANAGTLGNWPITGGGFRGGWSDEGTNSHGLQGEGVTGGGSQSASANGIGAGAGGGNANYNAGGGGGHAVAGTAGSGSGADNGAAGGAAGDTSDLTTMVFGGGGGGATGTAGSHTTTAINGGGNGGGIIILISNSITMSSTATVGGGAVTTSGVRILGGAGAGGSVLLICGIATLGTNNITSLGGAAHGSPETGGAGAVGRIAIHHSGTVTGTTSPTFDDTSEPTLVETSGASVGYSYFM